MFGRRLKKKVRVCLSLEEKEGVKKGVTPFTVGPCTPFYKTREADYMSGEREVGSVYAQQVYEGSWLHGCSCKVLVPRLMDPAQPLNASITWHLHLQLVGGCMRESKLLGRTFN
jgi:hypothetical protein